MRTHININIQNTSVQKMPSRHDFIRSDLQSLVPLARLLYRLPFFLKIFYLNCDLYHLYGRENITIKMKCKQWWQQKFWRRKRRKKLKRRRWKLKLMLLSLNRRRQKRDGVHLWLLNSSYPSRSVVVLIIHCMGMSIQHNLHHVVEQIALCIWRCIRNVSGL